MASPGARPDQWIAGIANDATRPAHVRALAAASIVPDTDAGSTPGVAHRSSNDVLGEVVKYRHLFGPAAAALAGRELWRRYLRDSAEGEAAEAMLRHAGVTRRSVMKGITGALTLAGASSLLTACELVIVPSPLATGSVTPSNNLLQIVVDDLNEYVGFLGGYPGSIHTPNLDALAAESLSFDQFHISVPICPPSRMTLMWGVDAPTHGVYRLGPGDLIPYNAYAAANPNHLVAVLAANGFLQVGGGKVYHDRANAYQPTWDEYFSNEHSSNVGLTGPDGIWFDYGTLPAGEAHPDNELTDYLIGRMTTLDSAGRFHMAAGYRLPHLGWVVPQEFLDLYPLEEVVVHDVVDDWDDLGPIGRSLLGDDILLPLLDPEPHTWLEWVNLRGNREVYLQHYLASISYIDHQIGRLLTELAAQPYADETVVTLVSDNGYHHGENAAMRKGTLRNQSTRVPFLIRHPDVAAQSFATPVSSLNYAPTLLGLLGLSAPVEMEGVDLLQQLPTGYISSYFGAKDGLSISESVISTENPRVRWVFHRVDEGHPRYNESAVAGMPEIEAYDRDNDPHETVNLLG